MFKRRSLLFKVIELVLNIKHLHNNNLIVI